jgi:hypothetical protein
MLTSTTLTDAEAGVFNLRIGTVMTQVPTRRHPHKTDWRVCGVSPANLSITYVKTNAQGEEVYKKVTFSNTQEFVKALEFVTNKGRSE